MGENTKKQLDHHSGFKLSLENAQAHIKSAEILAKEVNYGIATSHLVLSAEEGLKAYIIFTKYYDKDIVIKDFDKYFSSHSFKHESISDILFNINFIGKMLDVIINPIQEQVVKKKGKITTKEFLNARKQVVPNLISWLKGMPEIEYNKDWWKKANNLKMRGFYVDINKGAKQWISPTAITEGQYQQSHSIVSDFLKHIFILESASLNPEVKGMYDELMAKLNKGK